MVRSFYLIFLVSFIVTGCAQLPDVDYDIVRAKDSADATTHLQLLKQQSEDISGTPFVGGNKVTLLRDGAATYPAMLAAIHSAKHRIDMESFIFDAKEGAQFAKALLHRKAAGVEVNLIYDAIGSDDTPPDLFDQLRAQGIHIVEYNPVDAGSIIDSSFNHRDHRKLLIVDGRIAFTGGLNVSQLYRTKLNIKHKLHVQSHDEDPQHSPWRDTHVQIEGPVVGQFENLFMKTWEEQHGNPPLKRPFVTQQKRGDLFVQALDGTPDLDRYNIYRSLMVSIALARNSIHLTTGFFVPPPDMLDELMKAAQRGVDVTLILPSYSDSDLSMAAGHSYYEDLLEAGVHIYERQGAVLHAKTAVVDGVWSMVGSSNLDWRSVLFNNECNAVILGAGFGQQMEVMFEEDIAQSKRIDQATWNERPLSDRLDEFKAQMLEYFL